VATPLIGHGTMPTRLLRAVLRGGHRELMDATGMDSATIRNILGSMLFAKDLGILSKLPKSRVIDDAHVVSIDGAFRNPNNVRGGVRVGGGDCTGVRPRWQFVDRCRCMGGDARSASRFPCRSLRSARRRSSTSRRNDS
jgi:hypothetical protein